MIFLLAALVFLCVPEAFAQRTILLTDTTSIQSFGGDVALYEDRSNALTIGQIASPAYDSLFRKSAQEVPNIGMYRSTLWMRWTVRNVSSLKWMIELANPILDTIVLHEFRHGGWRSRMSGLEFPLTGRDFLSPNFIFAIEPARDSTSVFYLRARGRFLFAPLTIGRAEDLVEHSHRFDWFYWVYCGLVLMMFAYNLLIYVFIREVEYLYYTGWVLCFAFAMFTLNGYLLLILPPGLHWATNYARSVVAIAGIFGVAFRKRFLKTKDNTPKLHHAFSIVSILFAVVVPLFLLRFYAIGGALVQVAYLALTIVSIVVGIVLLRKGYTLAKYFLAAFGSTFIGSFVFFGFSRGLLQYSFYTNNAVLIGSSIEMILLSFILGYKLHTFRKEKEAAQMHALLAAQENERLVKEQNLLLERKVEERTRDLMTTQQQLVQQERLAVLGQLTAGIAHEIKNPLNFVNNFSKLSLELFEDYRNSASDEERTSLMEEISMNLGRIEQHGKRADGIVRRMMMHTRADTGMKESTDINALLEEAIQFVYQGIRSQDETILCQFDLDLAPSIPQIMVDQQAISRVFVNIVQNGIYATHEIAQAAGKGYHPRMEIWTRSIDTNIEIRIRDNGPGIPENIREKIFQPFFTTRPAGKGTGLGLSMSYNVVVNGHGGMLTSVPRDNGAEFVITLPV